MRRLRLFGLLGALGIAVVACTGDDDDDDGATPSPTPVFNADACQIVWLNRNTADLVEFWLVDVPVADWTVGTHAYGAPGGPIAHVTASWYEDYDLVTETYSRRAVATSGVFTFRAVTQTSGAFVRFEDTSPQPIWTIDTAGALVANQGTSGTGAWEGLLSDPYSANVTAGEGSITLVIDGTARELGQDLSYAVCYKNAALARPERMRETLGRIR